MSTLRLDETTGEWVIFAPSRRLRPHAEAPAVTLEAKESEPDCPFCPGNESLTPPEIFAIRDGADWQVRVIANKFPALTIEQQPVRTRDEQGFTAMGGCGAHEVIIESPHHSRLLAQHPTSQVEQLLRALQSRYRDLMGDHRFQTVVIFKNHGVAAGTSLAHPHWQLVATSVVPRLLRQKHMVATEYFDRTGHCLYCVLRDRELATGRRILATNNDFVAFMPYASHMPFETWIMPRFHQPSFAQVSREHMRSLAEIMKIVLLKLYTGMDKPAFNLTIDDVSRGDEDKEYFLWHVRILPRLATPAGFELGSGMSINTVLPEDATEFLSAVPVVNAVASS
jgi:UDPglucose--hexose-1-phosphate uridylyltransferase